MFTYYETNCSHSIKQTVFFNGTNCFLLMKQTVLHIETNRSP
ncbi:hypothetical protein HMPREF2141_02303 [Bacteroides uniformis]|nr:hypothetical protein HMPREF2141_02303 [Bacteroides uniformis]